MKKLEEFKEKIDNLNPDLPLDNDNSGVVAGLIVSDHPKLKEIVSSNDPDLKGMEGLQIMVRRLELLSTVKLTVGAAVFVSLSITNPGQAVLYAYYIHRKCDPNQIVDLEYIINNLFPDGMISEQQNREIWGAQKISTDEEQEEAKPLQQYGVHDNLLDYKLTWEK